MCLELKVRNFFPVYCAILATVGMVAMGQLQSPCPRTFQYERDQNGELYGTIGVYSFQDNVDIDVELSVGNQIDGNNNGYLKLTVPRNQVVDKIRRRQPLQYNVYFPPWTYQPPLVTRITVNGQTVCSGPPAQFDQHVRLISTVSLSHRFISTQPLSFQGPKTPESNAIGNSNPFFNGREPSGTKNSGNPFLIGTNPNTPGNKFPNQNPNQNPAFGNGFDDRNEYDLDILNVFFTPTTSTTSTTTTTSRPFLPINDVPFSENPFLNGRGSPPPPTRPGRPPPTRTRPPPPTRPRTPKPTSTQPPSTPRSNSRSSTTSVCGMPVVPNPLIVKGKSVPPGAFPWLTAMFASTGAGVEYRCCGSLVSHKHVITAAHCLQKERQKTTPISPDKLLFILGKHNIENLLIRDGEKMVGAQDVKIHPEYVPLTSDADIAVVILAQELEYTNFIRPICMWSESDDIAAIVGEKGKVVGWGRDEENDAMSPEPKQATIRIVSQEQCLWSGEVFKYITSARSFCAGERNNSGPCNGDSGSGFIMKRNGRWSLRGIVSISTYDSEKKTCDLSNYVAYTDVSKFRTWLLSIITI